MHDSSHSSTQILDKRLRIEMAILREMLSKKEITDITNSTNIGDRFQDLSDKLQNISIRSIATSNRHLL